MHRFFWTALLVVAFTTALSAQIPASKHVYIVAEENRSYEELVGNPNMPYLNSLIAKGALATQFYANQHNSLPDYFWLTAGQKITEDSETTDTFDVDNIVRHIMQLGLSYKAYAESLPYPGYPGLYNPPTGYLKRHVPLPYFSDMGDSPTEMLKLVPSTQLDADIPNGQEPNFAFITPESSDDLHNCPNGLPACEQRADNWLRDHIGPLLARPEFQPGGDGLLIVWTDEADLGTDDRCSSTIVHGCGGRIMVMMYGPNVKQGYQSTVTYHHPSVLRTMLMALGSQSDFPGAAENASPMSEMFHSGPSWIDVQSPSVDLTSVSPMHVVASAGGPNTITAMQVYVDNILMARNYANTIDASIPVPLGKHFVVVQSWDAKGKYLKQPMNVNVVQPGITIQTPLAGGSVSSPVHVVATAVSLLPIVSTRIYVDNVSVYHSYVADVDTFLTLKRGRHHLVVQNWDSNLKVTKQGEYITVQ